MKLQILHSGDFDSYEFRFYDEEVVKIFTLPADKPSDEELQALMMFLDGMGCKSELKIILPYKKV